MLLKMQLAVEAAVAPATGWSCQAQPDLRTYSVDGRPASKAASYTAIDPDPEAARQRGQDAAEAVLFGPDERLAELCEVYLLGLQAMNTSAPVVGLCGVQHRA